LATISAASTNGARIATATTPLDTIRRAAKARILLAVWPLRTCCRHRYAACAHSLLVL
jgi:hypothetical protein